MYDVVIIGAGPAGLSAAVYASRANMKTLIIDKGIPGGQLNNTEEIENYLGFVHTTGAELAQDMFKHGKKFGAEYKWGEVHSIHQIKPAQDLIFNVKTHSEDIYTKSVIIATGTKYRKLGIPGEEELTGRGVSWCAVCDGAFFKGKHVIVIGGGDSAVEEAAYLTRFTDKVTLVNRSDKLRAQAILIDRLEKTKKAEVLYNKEIKEFVGIDRLEGAIFKDGSSLECDGAFIYIGMDPISHFAPPMIQDEEGWILTNDRMRTRIPGIFAAGDIRANSVRQVIAAAGDGCVAALEAQNYIESLKS